MTSPSKTKEGRKAYYYKNRTAHLRRLARSRQNTVVKWLENLKDAPCTDCGRKFPHECMDFDHVRGRKLFEVNFTAYKWRGTKKLEREIAKCELVCANCHRTRTKNRAARLRQRIAEARA